MQAGFSVSEVVKARADKAPQSIALLGGSGSPLTYAGLLGQIESAGVSLRRLGIDRGDRVALVAPNGPESAVAFAAIAAAAACAPLNPAYSAAEFEFFLSDLKPKSLVVFAGAAPHAIAAAQKLHVPVIQLYPHARGAAGAFDLVGNSCAEPSAMKCASSQDVALLLHTSGSTSRPKLVPLTHANLCASAFNIAASLTLDSIDRSLNIMPLFHIHGLVGSILSSWSAGASVAAMPGLDAASFFDWVEEFRPTWYTAVPTMHRTILNAQRRAGGVASSLKFARSCSSPLPAKLMSEFEEALGIPLVEAYGMTEASHQMAINPLPPRLRKAGSVGRAAGCEIAIMDPSGNLLHPEEIGEVVIRGDNVTASHEFPRVAGWFRTGDEGRLDREGYLFLTGRIKEIVNRGGEKISPREIDEVLGEHPAVHEVVTFSVSDARLGEDVAAAVVLKQHATATQSELQTFAGRRLADFKIPRQIVFLPELPKGATGKPLRIGLADKLGLSGANNRCEAPFIEPETPIERNLAGIWKRVLDVGSVGRFDDFFALGGDSLLATQMIVRIRDQMAIDVPLFQLFANPVLATFAQAVKAAPHATPELHSPIPIAKRERLLPLSPAQQRMWFLSRFEESSNASSIPVALSIRGPLSVDALRRSFERIAARHETLRTRFVVVDGVPFQEILDAAAIDFRNEIRNGIPEPERAACAERIAYEETHRSWDLATDSVLRVRLTSFDSDDHLLVLVVHHIASDGWSKSVLFRELEVCYSAEFGGAEPTLSSLPIQYVDYAQWRLANLNGPAGERLAGYWAKRLHGIPALLDLPHDYPRPARQTFEGSILKAELPASLRDALTSASRAESATLHMTLLAAFAVLLYRHSGQESFCIGVPTAFRIREEVEALIGSFANTLPIRADVAGELRFKDLLESIRHSTLEAHAHADFPLERIIEAAQPQRSLSYSPLFQVLFQLRNFPEIVTRLEGLEVQAVHFDSGASQFDLSLEATETGAGLDLTLTFNTALFDRATAVRFLDHYRTLLQSLVTSFEVCIAKLPILTDHEQTLLKEWNQTAADYPRETALALFERNAAQFPDRSAVASGDGTLSYAELNHRAEEIAGHLHNVCQPGSIIGICVERSAEMLAALLGIWKAGAAYLPLDPSYPRQRLRYILENSGAQALLTEEQFAGLFPGFEIPVVRLENTRDAVSGSYENTAPRAEELAYVLYTSGSTGKPKGVPIRHKSLTNLLHSMQKTVGFTAADRLLALTTISFDISGLELFMPLVAGAEVIAGSGDLVANGKKLASTIDHSQATVVQATPTTWQILIDSGWRGKPGLKILCGGEPLPKALARKLAEHSSLWNCYGPTETTIWSTVARIDHDFDRITIGKPIDNTQAYVLGASIQPVPIGASGELYLGGDGLSPGYWRQPELSARQFVPNPFSIDPASRLYRTGDLVRYLADGRIEFLRRADTQLKLHGHRIELEEVESVAQSLSGIHAAAAAILDAETPEARLALFYVGSSSAEEIRECLRQHVPGYMIPSQFVRMDALPLTPNGKIDRKALAIDLHAVPMVPAAASTPAHGDTVRTATEELLIEIWEDIMDRRPIELDDDFFSLGGHSLLGVQLLARIDDAFGVTLPLSTFFEAPTVRKMLAYLGPGTRAAHSKVIPVRSNGRGTPLYVLHPSPFFRAFYLALPEDARVSALSPPAIPLDRPMHLEEIAKQQLGGIRESGPMALFGWCADGVLALEMAQQIAASGRSVPLVVLVDAYAPRYWRRTTGRETRWNRIYRHFARTLYRAENLFQGSAKSAGALRRRWNSLRDNDDTGNANASSALVNAAWEYQPRPYLGPVLLFRARKRPGGTAADPASFWRDVLPNLEVVDVPGNHTEMMLDPNVKVIAGHVSDRLGWKAEVGDELRRLSTVLNEQAVLSTEPVAGD